MKGTGLLAGGRQLKALLSKDFGISRLIGYNPYAAGVAEICHPLRNQCLRSEFAERVNKFYWKSVLWNEAYFIASCGGVPVSVLKRYIEQQDSPNSGTSGASNPLSAPGSHPDAPLRERAGLPAD